MSQCQCHEQSRAGLDLSISSRLDNIDERCQVFGMEKSFRLHTLWSTPLGEIFGGKLEPFKKVKLWVQRQNCTASLSALLFQGHYRGRNLCDRPLKAFCSKLTTIIVRRWHGKRRIKEKSLGYRVIGAESPEQACVGGVCGI